MSGKMKENSIRSAKTQNRKKEYGVITFIDHVAIITDILKSSGLLEKAKQFDGSLESLAFLMLIAEHIVEFGIAPIKAKLEGDASKLFNNSSHFLAGFILAYVATTAVAEEECLSGGNAFDDLLLS